MDGEREIERQIGKHGQILPVVLIDEGVRVIAQAPRELDSYHFAAHIHAVNFAEQLGQRSRNSSRAASNFKHSHLGRRLSLANVVMSVRISSATVFSPEAKNSSSVQSDPRGTDVVARVFLGAAGPSPRAFFGSCSSTLVFFIVKMRFHFPIQHQKVPGCFLARDTLARVQ